MKRRTKTISAFASLPLVALMVLAAGCGGGGSLAGLPVGGTPGSGQGSTGDVAIVLKDAPLSSLQTFTIDISSATLKGLGQTSDVALYPQQSQTGTLTVDLLSLQGFNQLLSSVSVPVGSYRSIEMQYSNPAATDVNNVAQNIQTVSNTFNSIFTPPLAITASSSQTIQIDIDLSRSVVDLGGNNILFTPVAVTQVTNQPVTLRQFPIFVTSVNTGAGTFQGNIGRFHANGGIGNAASGSVTVQTDAQTTYTDANGNTTTGNVTANLSQGDVVLVDGTMLAAVVDADSVTAVPGNIGGPSTPPSVAMIRGTIFSTDATANTVTVKVDSFHGPAATPPARFSVIQLNVIGNSTLERMGSTVTLGDLVPGNSCSVFADPNGGSFDIRHLSEEPAFVRGTVTAVVAGGGNSGQDLIEFDLDSVNQIPIAQLPFLSQSMLTDGVGFAMGDTIRLLGYFDGSIHFTQLQNGAGPLPPTRTIFTIAGQVDTTNQAAVNGSGALVFEIAGGANSTTSQANLVVTVPAGTLVERVDANGNSTNISFADAVVDLNSGNYDAVAVGTSAPTNNTFTADERLSLMSRSFFGGRPGSGSGNQNGGGFFPGTNPGGNTGGGPRPGGPPSGSITVVSGIVSGTASVNSSNEIEVSLNMGFDLFGTGSSIVNVVVPSSATLTQADSRFSVTNQPSSRTLTQAEMVQALNNNPMNVLANGSWDATSQVFTASTELVVMPKEFGYAGTVASGSAAAVNGNGDLTFTLSTFDPQTRQALTLTVTVPAGTSIIEISSSGVPSTITAAQAVTALGANPANVLAVGSQPASGGNFTADSQLLIAAGFVGTPGGGNTGGGTLPRPNPNPGPGPGPVPMTLVGTVQGTATLNSNNNIEFTLALGQTLPNMPSTVSVVVTTQNLTLFDRLTGPQQITVQQALTELNANPTTVSVVGTMNSTGSQFDANSALGIIR